MKYNFIKKTILCVTVIPTIIGVMDTNNHTVQARSDDWQYAKKVKCKDDIEKPKSNEEPSENTGDWSDTNSKQYQVFKEVFDTLTEEYGTSGAFASGVIANMYYESGGIPDISQGGGTFNMTNRDPDRGGPGGGLVQYDPYQKFSYNKNGVGDGSQDYFFKHDGTGWVVKNQVFALWELEFKNKQVMNYVKSTSPSYGAAKYGFPVLYGTIEEWLSTDDPVKSSQAFQVGYERPAVYHPEREELAKRMNAVFNKDDIKADKSKWKFADGGADDIDGNTSDKEEQDQKDACNKKDDGNFAKWEDDWTGSYDRSQGTVWRRNEVPEQLKKYAMDPESVGIKWGSADGWDYSTRNGWWCNNLASSMLTAVWHKKGNENERLSLRDGNDGFSESKRAAALVSGGKTSNKPRKGSIVAVPAGVDGTAGLGHVMFASHVFEDGSLLVVEQNFAGYSGQAMGMSYSWNYRFISSETASKFDYFYPGDYGYVPDKRLKMLG